MNRQERKEEKLFVDSMMYVIRNPVVVPPGFKDYPNQEMMLKAYIDKMKNVDEIFRTKRAGTMDLVIYLSAASNMGTLSPVDQRVYFYCFSKHYDISKVESDPVDIKNMTTLGPDGEIALHELQEKIFEAHLRRMKID